MIPPTPCYGCGQIQPHLIKSCIEDPATDPSYFDEESIRISAQIHQLVRLQASLLARRNRRRSPIYTLPFELLSAIFSITCASPLHDTAWEIYAEFNHQVIVLSSVSSHWRRVVFQMPELWDTVSLEIDEDTVESSASLLQHCLERGKGIDVIVNLKLIDEPQVQNRALHYQPIADALFTPENAHSIKSLRLDNPPVEWLAKLSQLPGIRTLDLWNLESEGNAPIILDLHTQLLRGFSLTRGEHPPQFIHLPPSLEDLEIGDLPADANLALLRQCPNLVDCHNYRPLTPPPGSGSITTPITLHHLTALTWSVSEGFADITSVRNLRLPIIQRLHLTAICDEEAMPVIYFCHQHSGTLTSLELENFTSWQAGDVGRLLRHTMPQLENLKLIDWPLSQLFEAVRVLTPSDEEFAHNEVKFLPRLWSLALGAADLNDYDDGLARALRLLPSRSGDDAADMIGLFLDMLERRRAGQFTSFRLNLPALWDNDMEPMWSAEVQARIRRIIGGWDIELLQDSKTLEWLF